MSLVSVKRRWIIVALGALGEHCQSRLLNCSETIDAMEECRRRGQKILYLVRCQPRRRQP